MQYILTGFTHETGFRVFAFEGIGEDRVRTPLRVRAEMALVKRYNIRVQELPLLCRRMLEQRTEAEVESTLTYGEAEMRQYADVIARDAAAPKKKAARKPPVENAGSAWRAPFMARPPLNP